MKLIPQAKPVKIRIKSGGEEHSSLDSLKRNFNISDIQSLLDGRLVRWLKQQGEDELANVISEVESESLNTLQGVMNVMQIFFKDYIEANGIHNSLELTKHWLNSSSYRKNGENLCLQIIRLLDNTESLEITKYLYKHREELKISNYDWFAIFDIRINKENEDGNDPEVLYIVGKMLWEGYQFNDVYLKEHYPEDPDGLELIEKAARLGCQKANLFIFEYNRKQKEVPTGRFADVDKEKLMKWIISKWETNPILEFSSEDYANEKEKAIIEFVCQCNALISYYKASMSANIAVTLPSTMNPFGPKPKRKEIKEIFEVVLQKASFYFILENSKQLNNILAKEKWFIIGLLQQYKGNSEMAKDAFNKAGDYPPAQYMLSSQKLLNYSDLKSMTFPSQVSYVVRCLFDYE